MLPKLGAPPEIIDKNGQKILKFNDQGIPVIGIDENGNEQLGEVEFDEDGIAYLGYN